MKRMVHRIQLCRDIEPATHADQTQPFISTCTVLRQSLVQVCVGDDEDHSRLSSRVLAAAALIARIDKPMLAFGEVECSRTGTRLARQLSTSCPTFQPSHPSARRDHMLYACLPP